MITKKNQHWICDAELHAAQEMQNAIDSWAYYWH